MKRIIPKALLALLAGTLAGCSTTDQGVWDEINARSAALQPHGTSPGALSQTGQSTGSAAGFGAASSGYRPVEAGVPIRVTEPLLPRNAAPAPAIAGLSFLTGRWIAINPNKTVNEEVWSPPRGNALMGSFRQIRLDGDCSFVDLSQISVEGDEILLRLRHLHGRLEVPDGRSELSVFRLVSLTKDRVEFTGITGAEDVVSMVYERTSETQLRQHVGFSPESGEEAFITTYFLDR